VQGNLKDVHFPELLLMISQQKLTGVLHVAHPPIEKDVYFQDGRAVFARSSDPDERFGELLLRQGKISARQFEDSAKKIVPDVRLGTILVQEGYLKASDLYHGVIDQVQEIIYDLFEWGEGQYEFHAGDLPSKEVITLSLSTPDMILTGVNQIRKWSWIQKGVGSLTTVYRKRTDWPTIVKKMSITPSIHSLIDLLENPVSLEQILRRLKTSNFETCKLVWTFLIIGILEKVEVVEEQPTADSIVQSETSANLYKTELKNQDDTGEFRTEDLFTPPASAAEELQRAADSSENELSAEPSSTARQLLQADPLAVNEAQSEVLDPGLDLSFSDLSELADSESMDVTLPNSVSLQTDEELSKFLRNFNEIHRYLYERLRIEMGSGVINFLSKIQKRVSEKYPLIFEGVELNEYGELNVDSLMANIHSNLAEQYSDAFEWLLEEEKLAIRSFLDQRKIEVIEAGLARILEKQQNQNA
jgi:hypothetical protein